MARSASRMGLAVLGLYLVLVGAGRLLGLTFQGFTLVTAVLALVAGALLIVGR